MEMGGRDHTRLCVMAVNSASPLKVNSAWPWKRGIFQIMQFSEGAYLALPPDPTFTSTLAEFSGVGIRKMTLLAYNLGEKFALTLIMYSTRVFPISFTTGCTLNGKLTFSVERYLIIEQSIMLPFVVVFPSRSQFTHLISSNSPSGGIKLMVLSVSNFPSLTHWWNWQSSMATVLVRGALVSRK